MEAKSILQLITDSNKMFEQLEKSGAIQSSSPEDREAQSLQFFLENFAEEIIREERENMAIQCESLEAYFNMNENRSATGTECADAIRFKNSDEALDDESVDNNTDNR